MVTTVYSNAVFGTASKPHAMDRAFTPSGTFPSTPQTVSYTGFDKVLKVKQGNDSLCYTYGHDRQRISMEEHVGNTIRTKRYVGNCEYVTESTGSFTLSKTLTYLTGPMGVYAVVVTENGTNTLHFILKDNLGSWTTITDADGNVEQRLSYDAWGNLRNPETWSGSFIGTPMFDRGFTGHEHLYDFGLINMNGKMYDPVMSSFLSVDQFVQSPSSSQNFNRYAYCLNNPLRYVDPDGEEFITTAIVVGSLLIGAYTGGMLTNGGEYNPVKWNWDSSNTFAGIVSGGLFGVLSGGAGVSIAAMDFAFCNTAALAASSLIYSTGMHFTGKTTTFDYGISISLGFASFDFTHGKFGYPFKRGNSVLDNIGYCLGAVTNLCDAYRYATWQVLSKQQRFDKTQRWAAKKYGENKLKYNPDMDDVGIYNLETDEIQLSNHAFSEDFGWAKSSYIHENNHRIKMLPYKKIIERLAQLKAQGALGASEALEKYYATFDSFAYEEELMNAARNGLSLDQFQRINQLYIKYSTISGRLGDNYNYTIWKFIKNVLLP